MAKIVLSGMVVGVIFDVYRIVRWRMGLNNIITFVGDLFFSFTALLVMIFFAEKANYLELRFYLFLGSLLGLLVYLHFFSRIIKKLVERITWFFLFIENTIGKTVKRFFQTVWNLLVFLMSFPYGLLRWFALLLYRISEALGKDIVTKVKVKLSRRPKE